MDNHGIHDVPCASAAQQLAGREIVRLTDARQLPPGLDQLVFYLPDAGAQEQITARLAAAGLDPVAQIDYWNDNGGVTYQDPDGREVVFVSWIYRPPT